MPTLTTDTFFNGSIQLRQDQTGYRYSIDAVLLAYYAGRYTVPRVLDLGTGCGIIPVILAFRSREMRIFGVEVQSSLARLAVENVKNNHMAERITILHEDMKRLRASATGGPVDLVVANPPFYRVGDGRINPNCQRAVARHEIKARLSDFTTTARRMLRTGGRFLAVFTAERVCDLIAEMRSAGIEPKMLRSIQSYDDEPAKLVLVEGMKGAKPDAKIPPPIVIYHRDGRYTAAAERMFQP